MIKPETYFIPNNFCTLTVSVAAISPSTMFTATPTLFTIDSTTKHVTVFGSWGSIGIYQFNMVATYNTLEVNTVSVTVNVIAAPNPFVPKYPLITVKNTTNVTANITNNSTGDSSNVVFINGEAVVTCGMPNIKMMAGKTLTQAIPGCINTIAVSLNALFNIDLTTVKSFASF